MEKHIVDDLEVIFDHGGRRDWGKYTFPVLYGMPVIVRRDRNEFHFNLLGQVRRLFIHERYWPDPQETLKRTLANDWIFLSTFGYEDSYALMKSHYVPLTAYHDPAMFMRNERPLDSPYTVRALAAFDDLVSHAAELTAGRGSPALQPYAVAARASELTDNGAASGRAIEFLRLVAANGREALDVAAGRLHDLLGGCLPVLPPDTIDVDYEVLPLLISDGCTGGCAFCKFQESVGYKVRDARNISNQITALAEYFGPELYNYNAVALGQNDALAAGLDALEFAARRSHTAWRLADSYHDGSRLFLFGGARTLLEAGDALFHTLNNLPYSEIHINVGLESPHAETLEFLGKPQSPRDVAAAFLKIQDINARFDKLHVSCNFLIADDLPPEHTDAVRDMLASADTRARKGTVFISPLEGHTTPRRTRTEFTRIKLAARLPVYLYLVQRL